MNTEMQTAKEAQDLAESKYRQIRAEINRLESKAEQARGEMQKYANVFLAASNEYWASIEA